MNRIEIPITSTALKYGYITWRKKDDADVRKLFGEMDKIDLIIGKERQTEKRIDWARRRIGITYTLTRGLPSEVSCFLIAKSKEGYRLTVK
jgi:hypothetical protein